MSKLSVLTLVGVITLGVTVQVSADASPPLYPPGSAVLPAGETMVQMLAETVEINIVAPSGSASEWPSPARAEVEARFAMRNQGLATEQMDVRFPLTDSDAWETIWDFAAYVDGQQVGVRKSQEPFTLDDSSDSIVPRWAVFPVTFEPGEDVVITVNYSTRISGWGWHLYDTYGDPITDPFLIAMDRDTATVYYILETGAGWYGPIESGVVVLRLPYAAGPANVFDLDAGLHEWNYGWISGTGAHLSGPFFAGNEARWEFAELEPESEDNLNIQFLWPDEWQRILDLEAEADQNPEDPTIALDLAGAYLAAGANIEGFASEYHCSLSQQTIQRALVYNASSTELLGGLEFIAAYCPNQSTLEGEATPTWTPIATSPSPQPPTPRPPSTPTAISTVDKSRTDEARLPTATPAGTSSPGSSSTGVPAVIGIGLIVLIVLILVAARSRRTPG